MGNGSEPGRVILRFQEKRETIRKKAEDPSRGQPCVSWKRFRYEGISVDKKEAAPIGRVNGRSETTSG